MVKRNFDAIHDYTGHFSISQEVTTDISATIIPIIMNDDAQGDPMSLNVNPEHASWAEQVSPNCYPDSEVRNLRMTIDIWPNLALAGKVTTIDIEYALIACAFPEDLDALDEKSGLTLKEILELQKETTDRQCYPLWNAIDMGTTRVLPSEVPGLTATQNPEAVSWLPQIVGDQRRYGKLKGLLKKSLPAGIRRTTLHVKYGIGGHKKIRINFIPRNARFINPYTFLGLMVRLPQAVGVAEHDRREDAYILDAEVLVTDIVHFAWSIQFDERNPDFHMAKV